MSRANVIQDIRSNERGREFAVVYLPRGVMGGYLTPLLKGECHVRPETRLFLVRNRHHRYDPRRTVSDHAGIDVLSYPHALAAGEQSVDFA